MSICPRSEAGVFSISVHFKFQKYKSLEPQAPLVGEIDIYIHGLFCTKFNSKQLLFEQFFDIIGNFGSIQSGKESIFLFQYNIIFETYQFFEPPSSTPGRDRHEFVQNLILNNFYLNSFLI